MITYYPKIYPDELVYSYLARMYQRSGIMRRLDFAEDLFSRRVVQASFEFIPPIKKDVLENILSVNEMSMETLIMEHTMLPYYGRFLSVERKKRAYEELMQMTGSYEKLLYMPLNRRKGEFCGGYCPACLSEDRRKYGETYWHRRHHIPFLPVCPKHGMQIVDTSFQIHKHYITELVPAETVIDNPEAESSVPEEEWNIVKYVEKVMFAPLQMKNDHSIGDYLSSVIRGSKYLWVRSLRKQTGLLCKDLNAYYSTGIFKRTFTDWQILFAFGKGECSQMDILMIAYFLSIPAERLSDIPEPVQVQPEKYNQTILERLHAGQRVCSISRDLYIDAAYVREVRARAGIISAFDVAIPTKDLSAEAVKRMKKEWLEAVARYPDRTYASFARSRECGATFRWLRKLEPEWTDEHFPHRSIQKLQYDTKKAMQKAKQYYEECYHGRPVRFTENQVWKRIHIKPEQGRKCYPEVADFCRQHREGSNAFWARKTVWGIKEMERQHVPIGFKKLRELTSIPREEMIACVNLIHEPYHTKILSVLN